MNSSTLIRMLMDNGWQLMRISGSHHTFKHPNANKLVTVPHPKKHLSIGTYRPILKRAGLLDRRH
ncbi:type II toxin-antitoxin system HicA family toxin [Caballeronia grimmiae]|uniref:type II toxin-antitoxin system HicA family toxin n=1 Tax=Caballeronia grimmiae TaxID=1071679 RepID=UPI0038BAD0E1